VGPGRERLLEQARLGGKVAPNQTRPSASEHQASGSEARRGEKNVGAPCWVCSASTKRAEARRGEKNVGAPCWVLCSATRSPQNESFRSTANEGNGLEKGLSWGDPPPLPTPANLRTPCCAGTHGVLARVRADPQPEDGRQ
jgi:hypothetical protein